MHVATSTIDRLVDYVMHTPADGFTSADAVERVMQIIRSNS
jgi:4-O-beta-D-mannosyl-D-glucose phosphorylase